MTLYLGLHFFRASSYYDFESAQLLSNLASGVVSLTCEQYLAAGPTPTARYCFTSSEANLNN